MARWLGKIESRGALAARLAALLSLAGLVALAAMTIADVFMRWLFNEPIDGVADIGPLVVAVAVAATFPFAAAGHHHVTIGFLGGLLSRRWRAWLDVLAAAVSAVFFVLVAWQFTAHAIDLGRRGQTTWMVGLPVAPWWAAVALLLALCALVQAIVLLVELRRASAPPDGEP